jgi:ABC-type antimicrobial peptide transport system permease subunit
MWPGEDALGKRFRILFSPWITVVGVVEDVKQSSLQEPPTPEMYLFDQQEPSRDMTIVVRTTADPTTVAPMVRERIRALDPELPIGAMQPMERVVWRSVAPPRFNATLVGLSGALALILALIGVYGVISYSVEQRRREIGVRMALGARPGQVVGLVLRRNARPVAIGLAVGLAMGAGLSVALKSELYGLSPTDPLAYAGVLGIMLLSGVAATLIPARRALRTDAVTALHHE